MTKTKRVLYGTGNRSNECVVFESADDDHMKVRTYAPAGPRWVPIGIGSTVGITCARSWYKDYRKAGFTVGAS